MEHPWITNVVMEGVGEIGIFRACASASFHVTTTHLSNHLTIIRLVQSKL